MITVKQGDIFCTGSNRLHGKLIQWVSAIQSYDGKATHNHSGVILNTDGGTFEALFTGVKIGNINDYKNDTLLIARPINVFPSDIRNALDQIQDEHMGQWYPYFRILLFLIPYAARWISSGKWYVCSEITAQYLYLIKMWKRRIPGTTPDMIADYVRENTDDFKILLDREKKS